MNNLNQHLKWFYFSTYHPEPGFNMEHAMRDFQAGKSVRQCWEERGLEMPDFNADQASDIIAE